MDLKKRDDIKKLNIEFPFGTVFESFQDILPSNSKEYVLIYKVLLKAMQQVELTLVLLQ